MSLAREEIKRKTSLDGYGAGFSAIETVGAWKKMTFHSLETALLDSEFDEFVKAIEEDNRDGALAFVRGFREMLNKRDPLDRDEALDWLSERTRKIPDQKTFSKVLEFLVENDLGFGR